jgi:hypothetical protein
MLVTMSCSRSRVPSGSRHHCEAPDTSPTLRSIRLPSSPIALRVDDAYAQFSGSDGWAGVNTITFSVVVLPQPRRAFQWYGLLGLGSAYTTGTAWSDSYSAYRSRWSTAIDGGGGVIVGRRVGLLIEAKYQLLITDGKAAQSAPVLIGVALR